MTDRLSLPPRYRRLVEELLRNHVPDAEVWAYGTRINGDGIAGTALDGADVADALVLERVSN